MTSPSPSADEVEATGHFRIYLGSAAGVGKTYAMLGEGHRRKERGADVVVGYVEDHGRTHTNAMVDGLEVVPRRTVVYRKTEREEMDLDALLARKPGLALVDELAHTNVPGSGKHTKRWEDVITLLDAGINVITTVNIQHLESIADVVEQMTKTTVRERVPDWVVRRANQIELVDSSPEQLRRRMLHGNIYAADKVDHALSHFFQETNLAALRELALRFLADETDEELRDQIRQHTPTESWETAERVVAAVSAHGCEAVIRRAARISARVKTPLDVVHVLLDDEGPGQRDSVTALRTLAYDVGATWHEVVHNDPAWAIMDYVRKQQATLVVIGTHKSGRIKEILTGGSAVNRIVRLAGERGIDVLIVGRVSPKASTPETIGPADEIRAPVRKSTRSVPLPPGPW